MVIDWFLSHIKRQHFEIQHFLLWNKTGKLIKNLHNLSYWYLPMEGWYISRALIYFLLRSCNLIVGQCGHGSNPKDTRIEDGVRQQCHQLVSPELPFNTAWLAWAWDITKLCSLRPSRPTSCWTNISNSVPCPKWRTREESSSRYYKTLSAVCVQDKFFMVYYKISDRCHIYQLPGKIFFWMHLLAWCFYFHTGKERRKQSKFFKKEVTLWQVITL